MIRLDELLATIKPYVLSWIKGLQNESGSGGDMYKSTYDTDNDGSVEAADDADTLDSLHAATSGANAHVVATDVNGDTGVRNLGASQVAAGVFVGTGIAVDVFAASGMTTIYQFDGYLSALLLLHCHSYGDYANQFTLVALVSCDYYADQISIIHKIVGESGHGNNVSMRVTRSGTVRRVQIQSDWNETVYGTVIRSN